LRSDFHSNIDAIRSYFAVIEKLLPHDFAAIAHRFAQWLLCEPFGAIAQRLHRYQSTVMNWFCSECKSSPHLIKQQFAAIKSDREMIPRVRSEAKAIPTRFRINREAAAQQLRRDCVAMLKRKTIWFRINCEGFAQRLRIDFATIAHRLRKYVRSVRAAVPQRLHCDCKATEKRLKSDHPAILYCDCIAAALR
jgi:hypothetical protein